MACVHLQEITQIGQVTSELRIEALECNSVISIAASILLILLILLIMCSIV